MFVPIGILFCYYKKNSKRLFSSVFKCAATSCGIELLQFIFKTGTVDIDDIILNTFGGFIGVIIFSIILFLSGKNLQSAKNFVEICASVFPPFLLFYAFDMFFSAGRYSFKLVHLLPFFMYFFIIYHLLIKDLTLKYKMCYLTFAESFALFFFVVFL